jgi:alkylated DNA repair dioxygenase AlkB
VDARPAQSELFDRPAPALDPRLPEGLDYREDFVSAAEEAALLDAIRALPLAEARYKAYTARRRTLNYGGHYDFDDNRLLPADPVADFLWPLRARLAAWAGVEAEQFANALVAEYRPGTPLGWHRDVPDFELVAGVSLAGHARMRWRPYPPDKPTKGDVVAITLPPRSAYLMRGVARWGWQHSISPTPELRYSITFRTRRARHATR